MHNIATERPWTEARLRFAFAGRITAVLVVMGWIAWFFPFDDLVDRSGTPLGGDFVMLYVAGQVVADGAADTLYDDTSNQRRSTQLFSGLEPSQSWPYRYPPTVAAAMLPLSQLQLAWSFFLFTLIQLSLLSVSLWLLQRDYSVLHHRSGWLWALGGSPLVLESLIGGQSSLLALTCIVGFLHFLRREQYVIAGILLAITLYKPNVAALLVVAALIVHPRLLRGFLPATAIGLCIALLTTGMSGVEKYVQLSTQLASSQWSLETPFWKVHGLAPLFQSVLPEQGKLACVVVGLIVSLLVAWQWRAGRLPKLLAVAILLCCNALFNPYVPIYDLVLLELALVLFCQAAYSGQLKLRSIAFFQCAAALLFVGPHLSQSFARPLGFNPFPILFVGLLLSVVVYEWKARAMGSEVRVFQRTL
ncbi:MAG: glycosyltransferase family 87 protein [Aureliella sp.]